MNECLPSVAPPPSSVAPPPSSVAPPPSSVAPPPSGCTFSIVKAYCHTIASIGYNYRKRVDVCLIQSRTSEVKIEKVLLLEACGIID